MLQGTVSDLHISQNGCYVDPGNRAYFSLHQGPKHLAANNAAETDRICNAELATARAWTVRDWLVQQGVPKNRIIIYDFPVEAKRGNSPLVNQSVAALVIYNSGNTGNCPGKNCPVPKLEVIKPANCEYTESQNTVNDTLVIKIVMTCDPVASTETRTQSTVDPEEEQTCPWYNQYPCWTKGQKGLFWGAVGVGTAAAILGTTCIDLGGGQGGKNGGGDGGGIRIGNCK
ncbi:MAG: hypothetical protein NTX82_04025 [Candidatus Parcubacteria bacterium]|nr:hypothetical protein [Candidatus Parcubacteria bacterium]